MTIKKLLLTIGISAIATMVVKNYEEKKQQEATSEAIHRHMDEFRARMNASLNESSKRLAALSESLRQQNGDLKEINKVLKDFEP